MSIIEEALGRLDRAEAVRPRQGGIQSEPGLLPLPRRRTSTIPLLALGLATVSLTAWWSVQMLEGHVAASAPAAELQRPVTTAPTTAEPTATISAAPGASSATAPPVSASAAPAGPAAAESPFADVAAAPKGVAPELPAWIGAGREAKAKAGLQAALEHWNPGLAALPPETKLISVAAFRDRGGAIAGYARVADLPGAFTAEGTYGGAEAYRVLVFAPLSETAETLRRAAAMSGIGGVSLASAAELRLPPKRIVQTPKAITSTYGAASQPPKPADPLPQIADPAAPAATAAKPGDFSFDGRADRIRALLRAGNFRGAAEMIRPLLLHAEARWEPWLWMGNAQLGLRNLAESENHLRRALELNKGLVQAWVWRALIAQEAGNHREATAFLGEAERLAPDMPEVHLNNGYSLDALGDRNGAAVSYRRFLALTSGQARYETLRQSVERRLESGS